METEGAEESIEQKETKVTKEGSLGWVGTLLGLAVAGRLAAAIALSDPLKARAAEVVRRLRESGLGGYSAGGRRDAAAGGLRGGDGNFGHMRDWE